MVEGSVSIRGRTRWAKQDAEETKRAGGAGGTWQVIDQGTMMGVIFTGDPESLQKGIRLGFAVGLHTMYIHDTIKTIINL